MSAATQRPDRRVSRIATFVLRGGAGFACLLAFTAAAAAQSGPLGGGTGPRSEIRHWNSVIDRLNRPAGGGVLTDAQERGPLDRKRDPLDPANLRKRAKNPQPEGSLVPEEGESDSLGPD